MRTLPLTILDPKRLCTLQDIRRYRLLARHRGPYVDEVIEIKDYQYKLKLDNLWKYYMKMFEIANVYGLRPEVFYGVVSQKMHMEGTGNRLHLDAEALDFVLTKSKGYGSFQPAYAFWTQKVILEMVTVLPLLQMSDSEEGYYHFGFYTSWSNSQKKKAYNRLFIKEKNDILQYSRGGVSRPIPPRDPENGVFVKG